MPCVLTQKGSSYATRSCCPREAGAARARGNARIERRRALAALLNPEQGRSADAAEVGGPAEVKAGAAAPRPLRLAVHAPFRL